MSEELSDSDAHQILAAVLTDSPEACDLLTVLRPEVLTHTREAYDALYRTEQQLPAPVLHALAAVTADWQGSAPLAQWHRSHGADPQLTAADPITSALHGLDADALNALRAHVDLLSTSPALATGEEQERWLLDSLSASQATWKVLAQQIFFSQRDFAAGDELSFSMDGWDGYAGQRDRLLREFADLGVNPVVLTGDVHANYASDVKLNFSDPNSPTIGVEFVGTSIATVWFVFRDPRFDYRLLIVGSVLPLADGVTGGAAVAPRPDHTSLFAHRSEEFRPSPVRAVFEIAMRPGIISLAGGNPDMSVLPHDVVAARGPGAVFLEPQ